MFGSRNINEQKMMIYDDVPIGYILLCQLRTN